MQRRRVLRSLGVAGLAGLAGCASAGSRLGAGGEEKSTTTAGDEGGASTPAGGYTNVSLPVPKDELNRGAPKDAIPAITEPAFGPDWSGVEASLGGDERVIGVERDGEARAYPLAILNWHEVVNDEFAGPLLVTYCPLCGSAVVAERKVAGKVRTFGVSGFLWHSDLVMYDEESGSLWSQILGQAINGPLTGTRLTLLPSSFTTWKAWREEHPETKVLLPPPKSKHIKGTTGRNYDRNPYTGYEDSSQVGIGYNEGVDERLHPKTQVIGITNGGVARAYPRPAVKEAGVVNDTVGGLPVVVTTTAGGDSLVAYVRRVDGETLTFQADGEFLAAGGSRWKRINGVAVDGPHEGTRLKRANDRSPMFWFAWADFRPGTEIYGK